MKIAACLICKDSKDIIGRALDSIRPFVDEINVYDTGSADGTPKLLREMNRRKKAWWDPAVGQFVATPKGKAERERLHEVALAPIRVQVGDAKAIPTIDGSLSDFSWARERSFEMVSDDVDWLFWMDDDDIVVGAQNLRQLAAYAHPSTDGFLMYYDYAQDERGANICQLWRERLLRRSDDGAWVNRVHEVWLPHGLDGPANYEALPIQMLHLKHLRGADPERYPSDRNLRILQAIADEAAEKGELPDLRTRAYLGTEKMAHGDFAGAVKHLQSYLEDPAARPGDERAQMFHKLALCMIELGQQQAATEIEFQALRERDDWSENLVGLMESFYRAGDMQRTIVWAKRALETGMPESSLILNPLELDLLPRVRLTEALMKLGQFDNARKVVTDALMRRPGDDTLLALAQQIEGEATTSKVVDAVLTLRETLIRHDENWKAWELFDAIPYIVKDHPLISSAKAMTRENVMHALKPEEYLRWYEDEPKESTVTDEQVPELGQLLERARFTLELAQSFEEEHGRKPRILDLGANDAWMSCFLWVEGEFVCDGIELNKASVEKGLQRMERFGTPATLVQGDIHDAARLPIYGTQKFRTLVDGEWVWWDPGVENDKWDIVTCYEVYEHVPDTDRLLSVMESVLSPDGFACITTPAGAFERGNLQYWNQVERKGHLRAVTPEELAGQLNPRGDVELRIHQDERLVWAKWKPRAKKGRVHIHAGGAWEQWSPLSIKTGGLGGSETALVYLAGGLAREGWDVRVFTDAVPGLYAGSVWEPAAAFDPTEEADAIIVSRNPGMFDVELHAPTRALWCHDHSYEITDAQAARMTDVIALSEWHRRRFAVRHAGQLDGKVRVIRNGIYLQGDGQADTLDRFPLRLSTFDERKPNVIYSSSADRGLDVLLEQWPDIRARVPDAELHIYYGWNVFDAVAVNVPQLRDYKAKVFGLIDAAGGEDGGVHQHGRVGQDELRAAMAEGRVWGYPTAFLETSCIGAMEARRSGMAIVTSDLGALGETIGSHGRLIPWQGEEEPTLELLQAGWQAYNESAEYRAVFTENVILGLTDETYWQHWHELALEGSEELDWSLRVREWDTMIENGRSH